MNNTRSLHLAKSFYFFYYGAWAFFLPFLALYYQSLGFSGSQIGLLASISPLITLFAAPFWAGLADASQRHKRVLLITITGAGISVLVLALARSFWVFIPIVAAYAFFSAPVIPLVDNSVLNLLGKMRDNYGKQRLWGAIGWGLAGPTAGWVTGLFGLIWSFPGYLVLAAFALLSVWKLPVSTQREERATPFWNGLRQLFSNGSWFLFLLVVFLSGAGLSMITNFFFLYLDNLQASNTLMGLSLTVATISEIPVLFFSGWMIRRWGPRGLMIISLAAYVVRAYGYYFAVQPWQALTLQLLHGLTFSAMWVAGVSFAAAIAPKGLGATAQGLFSSTVMGFGGIAGALIGGILLDQFGAAGMYGWSGTAVLLGLIIFIFTSRSLQQPASHIPDPQ
jgi:MFS transporter, PPP family, 3-phenylpropionic acid transporter